MRDIHSTERWDRLEIEKRQTVIFTRVYCNTLHRKLVLYHRADVSNADQREEKETTRETNDHGVSRIDGTADATAAATNVASSSSAWSNSDWYVSRIHVLC